MANKIKKYNKSFKSFLKNRSVDYNQYGRYLVKDVTFQDLPVRLISALGDLAGMVFLIYFWDLIFIMIGGGWFNFSMYSVFNIIMDIVLMISILGINTYLMVLFKGQSFGKIAMNFKVVDGDNKELDNAKLIIRQVVGFSLPVIATYIILGFIGVVGFYVLDGIVVLVDSKHRSIIDFVLKTKVVVVNEKGMKHKYVPPVEKKKVVVPTSENKYDLHIYSSFSHDGEMEVEDLFKQAKEAGIEVLSICDHNSIKANTIAKKVAPYYGIKYIPGINVDCEYEGNHIRLLGYGMQGNEERFTLLEYENLAKEKAVSSRRIQLFEDFTGFKVESDYLLERNRFQIISPEMIARNILSNKEYRNTKLLQPYLTGAKKEKPITNFVKDFFGKDAPASVSIVHPDAKDIISLIHASGGYVFIAHPMHSLRDDLPSLNRLVKEGIDGIELFTPYHSKKDMEYLIDLSSKNHLSISEGSEYHGPSRPLFVLGKTKCPKDVEEVVYKFIKKVTL